MNTNLYKFKIHTFLHSFIIVVDTVIGSSYLEKSELEISFNWNNHLIKFLKLLNCSVGLVANEKDAEVTTLFPLKIIEIYTFERTIFNIGGA